MLKKLIINGISAVQTPPVMSRDWYISTAGTGDGLTSGTPGPLALLNPSLLFSGDRIRFNKGDTFYLGGFSINNLNNIQVLAFGAGANPIILGSSLISTWINNGDGYWYSNIGSTAPKWVAEDDTLLRQGESAWIPITSVPSTQVRRVTAATINAMGSIIGAKIVAKEFSFRASEELTVTAYDSGTGNITFTGPLIGAAVGMPLKLYGQKQFATDTDDWSYDPVTERLWLKTTNPVGRNIRVINQDYSFQVSSTSNFVSDGVDYKHFFKHGIYVLNSSDCSIINCEIHANRANGIRAYGNDTTDLEVDNVEIHNCGLRGVELGGVQGYSITNCEIYDIGLQLNIGYPFDAHKTGGTAITPLTDAALPTILSNNGVIEHNEIYNVGYQGMQLFGYGNVIRYNTVHDYCLKWADGGGIYMYYHNIFNGSTSSNLVQNNLVYDGNVTGNLEGITSGGVSLVAGIYLDSGVNNNTINSNVIENPGYYGIFCNTHGTQHIITDNIVTGAILKQCQIRQDVNPTSIYPFNNVQNCVMTGNTFACEEEDARCFSLFNANNSSTFNPFTTVNNNHYVHPYGLDINDRTQNNGGAFTDMTLAEWQTYTSSEASSTSRTNYKGTPDANDVLVEMNATGSPVDFNTPGGYSDYVGAAFSNPVSIPAWYGLIYFQD